MMVGACRDGGLEASMDHEQGIMICREAGDVYATQEPAAAFHGRTAFCLDIHNEVRCSFVAADCSVSASPSNGMQKPIDMIQSGESLMVAIAE